ncbi:uncharacterized protein JCM6883_002944 [Sporobolomyces salmoneus]|uniref:uncharacterized protein n=1 Tax=Sporobolomyces salmoneus TaxID=183962 RepID=UPI00317568B2
MHAKTYRAPSQLERAKEANNRYIIEAEQRKLDAIKHEEKRIRETNRMERNMAKRGLLDVPAPYGSIGGSPYIRGRSRSFGGIGSSAYAPSPHLGASLAPLGARIGSYSPSMLGGGLSSRLGGGYGVSGGSQLGAIERRRRENELAELRARRNALEVEAARRQRTASMVAREREALARSQYLGSPHYHGSAHLGTPHIGQHSYGHNLGVPGTGGIGGLRRTRSFGSVPHSHSYGGSSPLLHRHHHEPHYPSYQQSHYSPRIGHPSPSLHPIPTTPRVVNNYTIYNDPHDIHHDRLPPIDPHYEHGRRNDFVITDLEYDESGRPIISELGWVEGDSSQCHSFSEDDRLNFAISDLTYHAQQRGANGVLAVETGEDAAGRGIVIVRGRAVVLG